MYLEAELFETVVDRGTRDYEELINKPKVNGVELSGNKSAEDLGLATHDGKIDSISVNGVAQTIDENRNVNLVISDQDTGATSVETVGDGNAVTSASYDSESRKITLSKGTTFLTEHQDISGKQDAANNAGLNTTDKSIVGAINEVDAVAKGANVAKGFANYQALINDLNSASSTAYRVGQNFYVQTKEVPDLWVMSVESSSVAYTYTTDSAFVSATGVAGGQQVGYYKLGQLETEKVDLSNYVQKNTTIAGVDLQDNITKSELQSALEDETHKFVSQVEKNAWNGKQNAINIRRV